jgi:hypothetical protein
MDNAGLGLGNAEAGLVNTEGDMVGACTVTTGMFTVGVAALTLALPTGTSVVLNVVVLGVKGFVVLTKRALPSELTNTFKLLAG